MAQFTHFVHELASSTLQSLLGAAPPNPCFRSFTNLFYTNVYLIILFFFSRFKVQPLSSKYISTFCYLSALKSVQHLQIWITIDSVILKTISLLLLQPLSNSDQLT